MYQLLREFENADLMPGRPVFCDVETCTEEGKSDGGLFGAIRLIQVYQSDWPEVLIYDCMFVDVFKVLEMLQPHHLVFHNSSYDLNCMNFYTNEAWLPEDVDDTFYLSKLFFPTRNKFDFFSCLDYAGHADDTIQGIDKKANQKADWGGPLDDTLLTYAACDVIYLERLYFEVRGMKTHACYDLDIKNLKYSIKYSRRGIPINRETVKSMLKEATLESEKLLAELPVNPNSPKQCQALLGKSSTDEKTLTKMYLEEDNETAGKILEARKWLKKRSRLKKFNREVIRGFYNPCAAISGRFSCTGGDRFGYDNLQNVPRDMLRCFEAPPGYVFIYKDYAGLELRMAVCWVGESKMYKLMLQGVDMHSYTASSIFGVPEDKLSKEMRLVGKVLNFQVIYGAMPAGLVATIMAWGGLLMPFQDVAKFRTKWLQLYPAFNDWHEMTKNVFNVQKFFDITTALGRQIRCYHLPDALNFPIQGSSAEVTKTSLRLLEERHPDENLISTIHDSNTLLVKEDEAKDWINALNKSMVDAWYYVVNGLAYPDLPMPAEAEAGKIWDF